ncbi:MAG: hypothetical protein E7667_00015 [Ruminococcaceae bacterium]|nr:hypothetical protein [Oscillospiraceae bacterium]
MKKEKINLDNIKQDFNIIIKEQLAPAREWRFYNIVLMALLSILVGMLFQKIWISLLIFLPAVYHIVRYLIVYRNYRVDKKAIRNVSSREDISISIQRFSHMGQETIYEPHFGRYAHFTKRVTFYYFSTGTQWRRYDVHKHYSWSKEYYISSKGLEYISVAGDEFYYIELQGHPDVAYIYPCKSFELDDSLKE